MPDSKIIDMVIDGQKAIFAELKSISEKIGVIPVQGQEIEHLKTAMSDMKVHCYNQHSALAQPKTPSLLKLIGVDLARAAALLLFAILGFTLFNNTQAYFSQEHTIHVVEEKKK